MKNIFFSSAIALTSAIAFGTTAQAGVSAQEAAALKSTLTPMGGEKAGSADGVIPAWNGGLTSYPGLTPGGRHDMIFKGDKPLFSITSQNMSQYADKLTEGAKAMFAKYPDYRMDVYKTERTAATPQRVYDNTFANATRATISDLGSAGMVPDNIAGGIPFPIPKQGVDVIWNNILAWRGTSSRQDIRNFLITAEGKQVLLSSVSQLDLQLPYYAEDVTPENFKTKYDGIYWETRIINDGPPIRAGEGIIGHQRLNPDKTQAWVYLTGQRRVRQLPNACCDTPTPAFAGVLSFDELNIFASSTARFDWKLVGKKEMYVLYNDNAGTAAPDSEYLNVHYLNPDHQRWELHRVWVVEATLRAGQRHVSPKSTYYFDEDTWIGTSGDRYDANGQLWKVLYQGIMTYPDIPANWGLLFGFNDMLSGAWVASGLNAGNPIDFTPVKQWPETYFDSQSMASDGIR